MSHPKSVEQTLAIIKPDAVGDDCIGSIIDLWENDGLKVVGAMMTHLSKEDAQEFYAIHKARPFFNDLVEFMCSGPILVLVLEGKNAVEANRKRMGATNPDDAEEGTIRKLHGKSIDTNAVHGSDSVKNADIEIDFFGRRGLKRFPRS
jgi:nucleoside-diphosphate kinase